MTIFEAQKAQWKTMKDKPLKDKLQYIATYYGVAIVIVLCVVGVVAGWITHAVTQKESALSGYLLNGAAEEKAGEVLEQEFLQHLRLDSGDYTVRLVSDVYFYQDQSDVEAYYVLESMVAQIASGMLDFVATDAKTFPMMSAYYADLRTVLTEEQLETYGGLLVYVEKAELEALTEGTSEVVELPTYYRDPAVLADPVPLGLALPEECRLLEAYRYSGNEVFFGLIVNSEHQDQAVAFLEFVLE